VENVRKSYGSHTAVDGISFTLKAGELFGLLGPNGAGKTTLISVVTGLSAADSGAVTLRGQPISPGHPAIRGRIGLAPQELALYPELSARENARFFGRLYDLKGSDLEDRVSAALEAVQLADRADDRAGAFSGGMKRRLNLALAVLHEPDILFLDEPTAGVDPQSRQAILDEVLRLNAGGMTVVYTSHYMDEVQAVCRRVGIVDNGKLIRCDALSELLKLDASRIRFPATGQVSAWGSIPGISEIATSHGVTELTAVDPAIALPHVVRLLRELGADGHALELRPPTLERVFLLLTGRELRD
jgi:ABC-2 type transport system ATP-binding protein